MRPQWCNSYFGQRPESDPANPADPGFAGESRVGANEKPGLMELMGRACNATDLSSSEGRVGHVERLGAMGLSQINPDTAEHDARDQVEIDPDAALGSLLIRIKAGRRPEQVPRREMVQAVHMLTHWVRQQPRFEKWRLRSGEGTLQAFVVQCLAEWLRDVCTGCHGVRWTGQERDSVTARRVPCSMCKGKRKVTRTQPSHVDPARTVELVVSCPHCAGIGKEVRQSIRRLKPGTCDRCAGSGRARPRTADRAQALRISSAAYEAHWVSRFDWLRRRLDALDRKERLLLQNQL